MKKIYTYKDDYNNPFEDMRAVSQSIYYAG